ncbi:protein PHYTOCHROME KINASE SUBSTRATE 1-like [Bidens hawaiensis]|uniref:protein PHYTOCHROME KINASE SUBSTRATE 1-like n=1 Tax=Bidens hawaiensis TaxID=980011 RepID=UPI0040496B66
MTTSDARFSYTNKHMTDERFMLKTMKNKMEDEELGIFGAEKYFKGVIDEELARTSNTGVHYRSNRPQEKHEESCSLPKPKTASSVRSESSWNSGKGLLVTNGHNGNTHVKKTSVKSLLASLGCKCTDKGSVKVTEAKQPVKSNDLSQKANLLTLKRADDDVNINREDCFTFPVLKHPELLEVKQEHEHEYKKSISLERKLMMSSWDAVTRRADALGSSRDGGHNDTGSDGSSDLFEIESFSTNENNSFLAGQATKKSMCAPSEASVDWSVATASVADFPTREDSVVTRNVKGNSGILLGCKSLKAVRVSGDERNVVGSGEKATVGVTPATREWCNRVDFTTPVAKIQADIKLMCAGSGLHISQNGFGVANPVHRIHSTYASSHHFNMKK